MENIDGNPDPIMINADMNPIMVGVWNQNSNN
jgi:hypothetical protein